MASKSSRYVLVVTVGDLRREIPVGDKPILVGRGSAANLRVPDDYCSRVHGKFIERNGDLYVEDVGARNGILVNGKRVLLDRRLSDGDEVRMGRSTFTVRMTMAPAAAVAGRDLSDSTTSNLGPEGIQFLDPAAEMGFQLLKLIAVSGMGLLFEAKDRKGGRAVALKILRPDRATEANIARAVEEAKSLSRIRHENVVRILTTGRMRNGESFLVMDFVRGLTATQLGKAGGIGIPEALKIAVDTCTALQVVHERGMVHRDVKPSNVMVEEGTERTVLIDFSLALTEPGGLASAPAGTVIFCAPEQVQPNTPTDGMQPTVDVYGLGGTLYFMLTGERAFSGSSTPELQQQKMEGPWPDASSVNKYVHPDLDEIILDCLKPDPVDRPGDLRVVRRRIQEVRSLYPSRSNGGRDTPWAPQRTRKRSRPAASRRRASPSPAPSSPASLRVMKIPSGSARRARVCSR
ncbi:MAG: protein kinase, partial [Planctomycetota bacterium]